MSVFEICLIITWIIGLIGFIIGVIKIYRETDVNNDSFNFNDLIQGETLMNISMAIMWISVIFIILLNIVE